MEESILIGDGATAAAPVSSSAPSPLLMLLLRCERFATLCSSIGTGEGFAPRIQRASAGVTAARFGAGAGEAGCTATTISSISALNSRVYQSSNSAVFAPPCARRWLRLIGSAVEGRAIGSRWSSMSECDDACRDGKCAVRVRIERRSDGTACRPVVGVFVSFSAGLSMRVVSAKVRFIHFCVESGVDFDCGVPFAGGVFVTSVPNARISIVAAAINARQANK